MTELSNRDHTSIRRLREICFLLKEPINTTVTELHELTGITYNKLTLLVAKGVIKRTKNEYVWDSVEPTMHMLNALRAEQNKRYFNKGIEPIESQDTKQSIYNKLGEERSVISTDGEYYNIRVHKDELDVLPSMIVFHQMFDN